jgi:hypothetical protein
VQNVRDGDTIVYYHPPDLASEQPRRTSFESKVDSILREVLKINDSFYNALETDPRGGLLFNEFHSSEQDFPWDPFPLPPDETVVSDKKELSVSPLPLGEEESEEEDSEDLPMPLFGSIEEAGKFFSKMSGHRWVW